MLSTPSPSRSMQRNQYSILDTVGRKERPRTCGVECLGRKRRRRGLVNASVGEREQKDATG
ncbi:hypothetical protein EYF80_050170 [Liparis tanakae]|uniref:Uncharacterized protein n=1 Tax=Liparis tanakae TaxID=230148 RepID=A0A4Z2FEM5_9TELE|nr:hypothetical protein EYF80_050170 [Liparis tanakae]